MHFFFQVCSHSCILFRKHCVLDHVGFVLGQMFVTTSKYRHKPSIQQILHWRLISIRCCFWEEVLVSAFHSSVLLCCEEGFFSKLLQRIIYVIEIYTPGSHFVSTLLIFKLFLRYTILRNWTVFVGSFQGSIYMHSCLKSY